jgi:hypothetical protein
MRLVGTKKGRACIGRPRIGCEAVDVPLDSLIKRSFLNYVVAEVSRGYQQREFVHFRSLLTPQTFRQNKKKIFSSFAEVYIRFVSSFTIALANVFCQVDLRSPAKRGNYVFCEHRSKGILFFSSKYPLWFFVALKKGSLFNQSGFLERLQGNILPLYFLVEGIIRLHF